METTTEAVSRTLNNLLVNHRSRRQCVVPGATVVEWYDSNKRQPKMYEVDGHRLTRYQYRRLRSELERQGII